MFGLFASPIDSIKKRVPSQHHDLCNGFEQIVHNRVDAEPTFNPAHRPYAVGFVISVWACNSHADGKIQLTDANYLWIKNMGMSWAGMIKGDLDICDDILYTLIAGGVIPPGDPH